MNETILSRPGLIQEIKEMRRVIEQNEIDSLYVKMNSAKNPFLKRHYTDAYEKAKRRFKMEELQRELRDEIYS